MAATPFNNCNLTQKSVIPTFNYVIIIDGLNVGDFIQYCQSPKFTSRQYFILYSNYVHVMQPFA